MIDLELKKLLIELTKEVKALRAVNQRQMELDGKVFVKKYILPDVNC